MLCIITIIFFDNIKFEIDKSVLKAFPMAVMG